MAHRLTDQAEADLEALWDYVSTESGSDDIADSLIDALAERFTSLATFPYLGRARDRDLGAGRRSLPVYHYVIIYSITGSDVLILRVVHGRRDLIDIMKN